MKYPRPNPKSEIRKPKEVRRTKSERSAVTPSPKGIDVNSRGWQPTEQDENEIRNPKERRRLKAERKVAKPSPQGMNVNSRGCQPTEQDENRRNPGRVEQVW